MAFVRLAFFPGATAEHFADLAKEIGDEVPDGRLLFAAGPGDGGWQVVQVWQSKDELDAFNQAVLFPAFARLGERGFPAPSQVTDFESAYLA
ncbi:hypothetical protein [Lentzea sp. E54]|uniref:hypothetical protein n=1 Tax=Lentzea xerophila TaxID=3435883 RepID=UPI003DA2265B